MLSMLGLFGDDNIDSWKVIRVANQGDVESEEYGDDFEAVQEDISTNVGSTQIHQSDSSQFGNYSLLGLTQNQ